MHTFSALLQKLLPPEKISDEDLNRIFEQNLILTATTVENLSRIIYPIKERRNLLLVGDAGIGKNALIYYINQQRKIPTIRFSFNQDTLPEDLIGSYRILPDGFHWQDGPLVEAMRLGFVFVADEMNLASPEILKRFASVLENRSLTLLEKDAETITAHPRFLFVATQNPPRGFEGRKILPESIKRLFTILYLDNYSDVEEKEIIGALYPQFESRWISLAVDIQRQLEKSIWSSQLAKDDLEHYHFNLRTLQRLFSRSLEDAKRENINIQDENLLTEVILPNLLRFYVTIFPSQNDRQMALEILHSYLQKLKIETFAVYKDFLDQQDDLEDFIQTAVDTEENSATEHIDPLPITESRRQLMTEILRSLQANENLLLEGDEAVRIGELLRACAVLVQQPVTSIYLSRGMHTSDIIGALRPVVSQQSNQVQWIDGPLTKGLKQGHWVILENIEAAGSELIEKLNMLLDHAATLVLPPEASGERTLLRNNAARIIAIKRHRKSRNQTTISRAFRNRFFSLICRTILTEEEVRESLTITWLNLLGQKKLQEHQEQLLYQMSRFHQFINEASDKKKIAMETAEKVFFREEHSLRWLNHIFQFSDGTAEDLANTIERGLELHYLAQLPSREDRQWGKKLWQRLQSGLAIEKIQEELRDSKKKILFKSSNPKKIDWDPRKHWRPPNTGKAAKNQQARKLKKGIRINTPETGGSIKEGPDAWYGQDTQGNQGVGEPAGGGGAWGFRTEELFNAFLQKYKPKWDYTLNVTLADFYATFGAILEAIKLDLNIALDSNLKIERHLATNGFRIDARKYLTYMANQGSDKVFDHSRVYLEEDRLKGLEFIFLVNKGRRIFNFEYCLAEIIALQCALEILLDLKVPCKVFGYSDIHNFKENIDLLEQISIHNYDEDLDVLKQHNFQQLTQNWHGDTIEEYQLLLQAPQYFGAESHTRIIVMVSDFRGHRAKQKIKQEIYSFENQQLAEVTRNLKSQNYSVIGMQVGNRNIAEHLFDDTIWVNGENFYHAPQILANLIKDVILREHQVNL